MDILKFVGNRKTLSKRERENIPSLHTLSVSDGSWDIFILNVTYDRLLKMYAYIWWRNYIGLNAFQMYFLCLCVTWSTIGRFHGLLSFILSVISLIWY
jgi:hypothetical protein